ncbi:hypothetical protein KI387_035131 [Taxus chinensis]|uniref:Pentatricopeptide repeat-containing protein n=1 Tax=Taxus chinensis TaxID=29808 RepID=A0AA38KYR7_TAXCH|nr:hypothetical protein KI387_035131 [Taxus chinensis]
MGIYKRLITALASHASSVTSSSSSSLRAREPWTVFRRGMREVYMSQAALDAAAERRARKRKLRVDPPMSALQRNRYGPPKPHDPNLPEPINVLVGDRLSLHNRLQALSRSGKLDDALVAARQAQYSRIRPTIFTYNSLLGHLHRAAKYEHVFNLFAFMRQAGVIPNVVTYNIVLGSHAELLDMEKSFAMLQMIYDAKMSPSNVTFSHLMRAHFRLEKYEDVMRLFREMLEKCYGADPPTYANTIEGFVKGGAMDQATELYMEMRKRGSIFSEPVFCNLIKGYIAAGRTQEALDVFEFVPEKVERTALSGNAVIEGFCNAGRIQDALDFFEKLGEKDLKRDALSIALLMDYYIEQEGNLQEAEKIFRSAGLVF